MNNEQSYNIMLKVAEQMEKKVTSVTTTTTNNNTSILLKANNPLPATTKSHAHPTHNYNISSF